MINRMFLAIVLGLTILASRAAIAHEHAPAQPAAHGTSTESHRTDEARPVLPDDPAPWAGTMVIIILSMFLMAAVIGPMVRMEIPDESHHDDHGHGHGHDDHAHGHGH